MKKLLAFVSALVLVSTVCAVLAWASPAVGVTPTLIGRATYETFKVKTNPHSLVDFEAKAKSHVDLVVRMHDYAAGGSMGWHTHPGPVFINVLQGQVTFYEMDDPTCTIRTSYRQVRATWIRGTDTSAATKRGNRPRMCR